MASGSVSVIEEPSGHAPLLRPYMRELDALRGFAILLVLLFHAFYFSAPNLALAGLWRWAFVATSWGWTGVNLFFVLSGFLITGILIDALPRSTQYFSHFYLRRALRILPVYLVTIVALLLLRFISLRYAVVSTLFLANAPSILHARSEYGPLWSLAVEEQFYLGWPLLVRRLRVRGITVLAIALCIVCPILRALAVSGRIHMGHAFLGLTWMIADNLAIGALLAVFLRSRWCSQAALKKVCLGLLLLSAALATVVAFHRGFTMTSVYGVSLGMSALLMMYAGVLSGSIVLFHDRALSQAFAPLVFLGDISYGLYLIHVMALELFDQIFLSACPGAYRYSPMLLTTRAIVAYAVAIGIAYLSRTYFENPILRWKQRIA